MNPKPDRKSVLALGIFVATIALALVTLATADTKTKPTSDPQLVDARPQRTELVWDHDCIESIVPDMDAKVHLPINEDGKPLNDLLYITGATGIHIKPKCQPHFVITREPLPSWLKQRN